MSQSTGVSAVPHSQGVTGALVAPYTEMSHITIYLADYLEHHARCFIWYPRADHRGGTAGARGAPLSVKVPTLVMLGQHDYICRNAARLLSENIPHAVLHRIEGVGHMSPLEQPDEFSDVVTAFFARA